jgi:ribulose-5-phosphate 4-epimerase/fuculose-1-phosphate aldolase
MDDEKPRLVANLGDKRLLILRNHGLLACGRSIPEAFMNLWSLERSCEIQVACDSTGRKIIPVRDEVLERSEQLMTMQSMGNPAGELEFDAFVRIIDKIDTSYKK